MYLSTYMYNIYLQLLCYRNASFFQFECVDQSYSYWFPDIFNKDNFQITNLKIILLISLTFIFSLSVSFKISSWLLPFTEVIDVNGSIHSNRSSITFFTTFNGGSVSEDLICCILALLCSFSVGSAWIRVWLPPQLTYKINASVHLSRVFFL